MTKKQRQNKRRRRQRVRLAKWLGKTAKRKRRRIYSRELKPGTGRVFGNTGGPDDEKWAHKNNLCDPVIMQKALEATYFPTGLLT